MQRSLGFLGSHIGTLLQALACGAKPVGAHRINLQMNSDSEEEAYSQMRLERPPLAETLKGLRGGYMAVASRLRVL